MTAYSSFARFYDPLMGDASGNAGLLRSWIAEYRPSARSLLELGCGTGSILAQLSGVPSLTGVDRSPEMLEIARAKVPAARLVQGDISEFSLGERYDVVVCMFDTINHLLTFEGWTRLFERVEQHLAGGGLFVFDVNTLGKLRALGDAAALVRDFDGHVLIMDVEFDGNHLSTWDIRVFERVDDQDYVLHHERIGELGAPLDDIRSALHERFVLLEEFDPDGGPASDESMRVYFVCARLADPDLVQA